MNKLNVLYSTDNNYLPHAAASIYSLLDNNRDFHEINILVIDDNISNEYKIKLQDMILRFSNCKLNFFPFDKLKFKLGLNDKSGYAQIGYARLMISDIIDDDKIIYIDCDTIINGSLKELWSTDISDFYVAGVQDNPAMYAVKAVGMDETDRYINGGVLLINLKKWKKDNLECKIIDMIREHRGFVVHHDQGIINGVCKNKILILHPKYNVMSQFFMMNENQIKRMYDISNYYTQVQLNEAIHKPVIIHFISKFYNRPWYVNCSHPLKHLYVTYLNKTPFSFEMTKYNFKKSVKIRKLIYKIFPFSIYMMFEKALDKKRKKNIIK